MRFHGRTGMLARPAREQPRRGQVDPIVERNVEAVARIEDRDREKLGLSDHLADWVTSIAGSMVYVWLHVAWFSLWILANVHPLGLPTFDRFPFGLLTMIVSLEAIFLSTFVLISQNRQAMQADRRARVEMQINIIAEQEITKLIKMVSELHRHAGLEEPQDAELGFMKEKTHVEKLAAAVDASTGRTAEDDPSSAADIS